MAEGTSSNASEIRTSRSFKIKLEYEHIKWGSLKLDPSHEFEEHIVGAMSAANRKLLQERNPVHISFHDVDTGKNYKMKFEKKASSWYQKGILDPTSKAKPSSSPSGKVSEQPASSSYQFVYNIGPAYDVLDKRKLLRFPGQEIGLRWSSSKKDTLEFSVT